MSNARGNGCFAKIMAVRKRKRRRSDGYDQQKNIRTVMERAGCGRFSILLAKQGCRVPHFDISQPMINKAKELAGKEGVLDRITFVKGALEHLGAYKDRAFDLVISIDAPVSYTYPNQERVIGELVRICRKRIMLSVSSRLGYYPGAVRFVFGCHSENNRQAEAINAPACSASKVKFTYLCARRAS